MVPRLVKVPITPKMTGDTLLKYSIRPLILTIFLVFSSQSPATAGELLFGEGDKWVVFQGPILLEEVDQILSQLDDKKPKQILLNSV